MAWMSGSISLEVRRKIGYLPEMAPVYQDMNVVDYLRLRFAICAAFPTTSGRARIKEIVARCGLDAVLNKDVGQLSKGYRQRVGLAQAMVHDPDILVLDEPTAGLDPNQIAEIRMLIKELGRGKDGDPLDAHPFRGAGHLLADRDHQSGQDRRRRHARRVCRPGRKAARCCSRR